MASGEWLFLKPGRSISALRVRGGAFLSVGAFLAGNAVLRRRKRRGLHAAGIRQGCLAEDRRDIPAACGLLPQEHVYHAHGGMRPGNAADRTHPGAPGFLRTLPAAQTNSFMFRCVWYGSLSVNLPLAADISQYNYQPRQLVRTAGVKYCSIIFRCACRFENWLV